MQVSYFQIKLDMYVIGTISLSSDVGTITTPRALEDMSVTKFDLYRGKKRAHFLSLASPRGLNNIKTSHMYVGVYVSRGWQTRMKFPRVIGHIEAS